MAAPLGELLARWRGVVGRSWGAWRRASEGEVEFNSSIEGTTGSRSPDIDSPTGSQRSAVAQSRQAAARRRRGGGELREGGRD